jgi:hypothetical protein
MDTAAFNTIWTIISLQIMRKSFYEAIIIIRRVQGYYQNLVNELSLLTS